jgi:BlaI family penicillinase repressor
MKKSPRISPAEWQVMKIVWAQSPILAREIIARLAHSQEWSDKTIRTLLARLVKKRVISFQREGRAYLYRPLAAKADCVQSECQSFIDRFFEGALAPMFAQFLQSRTLSDPERSELRLLLEAGKKPRKRN